MRGPVSLQASSVNKFATVISQSYSPIGFPRSSYLIDLSCTDAGWACLGGDLRSSYRDLCKIETGRKYQMDNMRELSTLDLRR